ncbi:hypothetical protein [Cellulomonas sp. Y8]|uniref:hypothetical protein n=1 Tax=Cellulomonas sp. Y8 TaxID=2591145 RepID=UPI003D72730F
MRAELVRGLTLPTTRALLVIVALLAIVPAAFAETTVTLAASGAESSGQLPDTFGLSLSITVFSALAALWRGCDLRSGELSVALLAVPSRTRLAVAEALALGGLVATGAAAAFVVDRGVRSWIDPGSGPEATEMWRTGTGFVIASVTVALLAATLVVLLRNAMLSIAVLLLLPLLVVPLLERVAPPIAAALPFSASGVVVAGSGSVPMSWTAGVAVLTVWASASVGTALLLLHRRDL